NDGDVDIVVNNVNAPPDLFRTETDPGRHWLLVKLVGTASNRSAIGARLGCTAGGFTQWQEVRGGGSYISQNDLRAHFGLGAAAERLTGLGPPPAEPRLRELTGVAYYHAGDPLHAIDALQAVLDALRPDSPARREAIQVLGLSHYLAGHLAQSIPFLEQTRA